MVCIDTGDIREELRYYEGVALVYSWGQGQMMGEIGRCVYTYRSVIEAYRKIGSSSILFLNTCPTKNGVPSSVLGVPV